MNCCKQRDEFVRKVVEDDQDRVAAVMNELSAAGYELLEPERMGGDDEHINPVMWLVAGVRQVCACDSAGGTRRKAR